MHSSLQLNGVVELDADGHVVLATTEAAALIGTDPETARGRPFDAWLHPDDREGARSLLSRMRAGDLEEASVRVASPHDRPLWVRLRRQRSRVLGYIHEDRRSEEPRQDDPESDRLRLLATVTAQGNLPFLVQLQQALTLTTELLGFDIGIVSRVEGDDYVVVACHAPEAELQTGDRFSLGHTYCAITLDCRDLLAIEHMGASPHHRHPCYEAFGLESYVGAPVYAGDDVWGTLNFSSPHPRQAPLSEADRDLVRLLALWIGGALDRQRSEDTVREQGAHLLAAVSNAPVVLSAFDPDGVITLSMGRALRSLGLQDGEAVGQNVFEMFEAGSTTEAGLRHVLGGEAAAWVARAGGRSFEATALPTAGPDGLAAGGICVAVDVTDRADAQRQAEREAEYFRRLLQATSRATGLDVPFEEQAAVVLREVADLLGLEAGLLARVEEGVYACAASVHRGEATLAPGDSVPLDVTYCDITVQEDDVVAIEDMAASPYRDHPCFESAGWAAYLGAPVHIDGRIFGALSFCSTSPRSRPFTETDRNLMRLAAQWAGAFFERERHEEAFAESQRRFRTLSEATFEGIFFSEGGIILDCNTQGAHLLGLPTSDDCIGRAIADFVPPESLAKVREMIERNRTEPYETRVVRPDGSQFWAEVQGRPVPRGGRIVRLTAIRDISKRKEAQAQTRAQSNMLAHVSDAVIALDLDHRVTYWNAGAALLHDVPPEDAKGRPISDVVRYRVPSEEADGASRPAGDAHLALRDAGAVTGDLIYETPAGKRRRVSVSSSTIRDENGDEAGMLAVVRDVTAQRRMAERLRRQALRDALTGLPNRIHFREEIERALASASPFATLFIDLDRFKTVNDSLGHEAGDRLLQAVARRMLDVVGEAGTVARLGGDEFAVLAHVPAADAAPLAQRVLEALRGPLRLGLRTVVPGGSVGVVADGDRYGDPDSLLRDADTAMYEAKRSGRGVYTVFDPSMHEAAAFRLGLEHDLRQALAEDQLRIHFQPVVRLDSGAVVGFESLVRWEHPELGLISPGTFLPLAEEVGLVTAIDEWVLDATCRTLSEWAGLPASEAMMWLSVNCSDQSFLSEGLAERARRAAEGSGLCPDQLILELTERAFVDPVDARAALNSLRSCGIKVCIDDFGAGYSSLGLLHSLPVDGLKIDRSFVSDLGATPQAEAIVRAVIAMANDLGLRVVAEGIETAEQLAILRDLGCEMGQGYFFSPPVPPPAAAALVESPPWAPDAPRAGGAA